MEFFTRIAGIPCICCVDLYTPARPMKIYGSGFGDCEPPEDEEFEFHMKDNKGRDAPWLDRKVTDLDAVRLYEEFIGVREEEGM